MATREESFEQAAQRYYRSEMKDVQEAYDILMKTDEEVDEEEEEEEGVERPSLDDLKEAVYENNQPLSVVAKKCVEVTLGTGGPACGYFLFGDEDGADSGFYWYQDWFQPKRIFWLDQQELAMVVEVYQLDASFY